MDIEEIIRANNVRRAWKYAKCVLKAQVAVNKKIYDI